MYITDQQTKMLQFREMLQKKNSKFNFVKDNQDNVEKWESSKLAARNVFQ